MTDNQLQDRLEPVVRALLRRHLGADVKWRCIADDPTEAPWIRVFPPQISIPNQGWKLHVSGASFNAVTILESIVPVLVEDPVAFKLIGSKSGLDRLNQGSGGEEQIGKFVTIYPRDQEQFLRLGGRLELATHGLIGPAVATDRPFTADGLVYYRYGANADLHIQLRSGEIVPAIETPEGRWVPDLRQAGTHHPTWIDDPLARNESKEASKQVLWAGRYMPVSLMYKSLKGRILLAIDVETPQLCVIKEARRHALLGPLGQDARDALRWEARVLRCLDGDGRFPHFIDLFELDGSLFLVMEDLKGSPLSEVIARAARQGRLPEAQQLLDWARQMVDLIAAIHTRGFVYTDLKSSNILVMSGDKLALVDFELTHALGRGGPVRGMGTPGYLSKQRLHGQPSLPADDIYGLGALLYFIATGAEPSLAPDTSALNSRRVEWLNPDTPETIRELIDRCLAPDPRDRPQGMDEVRELLTTRTHAVPRPVSGKEKSRAIDWYEIALQTGDKLIELVMERVNSRDPLRPIALGRRLYSAADINSGLAGGVVALAEFYTATADRRFLRTLLHATRCLRGLRQDHLPSAGLFVGWSGVVTALLWAGWVTEDVQLIEEACAHAVGMRPQGEDSPDLFNGIAGQLRLQIQVAGFTDATVPISIARACCERLLTTVQQDQRGMPLWEIPAEHGGLSGQKALGYAHGCAGIADALLDLYKINQDQRIADLVLRVTQGLMDSAQTTLKDGSGKDWQPAKGHNLFGPFWCHGAAGIGRFLFNAWRVGLAPKAEVYWRGAARSAAQAVRWAGPTQCHGLAGSIEMLLDLHAVTGEAEYFDAALSLAPILHAWLNPQNPLIQTEAMDWRKNPGFMIGMGGIAVCLLRLSGYERVQHALYPDWKINQEG